MGSRNAHFRRRKEKGEKDTDTSRFSTLYTALYYRKFSVEGNKEVRKEIRLKDCEEQRELTRGTGRSKCYSFKTNYFCNITLCNNFTGDRFFTYQNVYYRQVLAQRLLVAGIRESGQCQSKKLHRRRSWSSESVISSQQL